MTWRSWLPAYPIERGTRRWWCVAIAVHVVTWAVASAYEQGLEPLQAPLEALRQWATGPNLTLLGFLLSFWGVFWWRPQAHLLRSMPPELREGRWSELVVWLLCVMLCMNVTVVALHAQGVGSVRGASSSLGGFLWSELPPLSMIVVLSGLAVWLWNRAAPEAALESRSDELAGPKRAQS